MTERVYTLHNIIRTLPETFLSTMPGVDYCEKSEQQTATTADYRQQESEFGKTPRWGGVLE